MFTLNRPAENGDFSGYAGQLITTLIREDVNQYLGRPPSEKHGFNWPLPSVYYDGQRHTVYLYAIDTTGNNYNPQLNGSPKTFELPAVNITVPPLPNLDTAHVKDFGFYAFALDGVGSGNYISEIKNYSTLAWISGYEETKL